MEDKRGYELRVSTTDPEARIMRTSDGDSLQDSTCRSSQMLKWDWLPTCA